MAPSKGVIGAVLSVMFGDPAASTCAADYIETAKDAKMAKTAKKDF